MRVALPALTTAALLGATPAAAQAVCRPNQLGTVSCPAGPRPAPRPEFDAPVQALERVREAPEGPPERGFIPARRTRGLGGVRPESDVVGPCRPDRLGNLHCR
jgi:hypothetical protein